MAIVIHLCAVPAAEIFTSVLYRIIDINLDNFAHFCSGRSRRGSSGLFLNNKPLKRLFSVIPSSSE